MKRTVLATILLGTLGMVIPAPEARAQVSVSVSIGGFYDELSPYGEWVDCTYGECWVPRGVGEGWQPYTNGQWIYTRYGWTWVSRDPWGGDPYHYGTWAFIGRHGWVWVPGTVWAPAWVTWSYSDRYVGWAPMPPTVAFGSAGYSGRAVVLNEARYVFVPTNRFVGTNVTSVRVEPGRNAEIFRQAKPVTRFEVSGGVVRNVAVPLATVQRAMGSKIETREISTANTTPRTVSSGGVARSGRVAIVAPARDMKAARASRQTAAPASPQHERVQAKQQPVQQQQVKQQQVKQQQVQQQQVQRQPVKQQPVKQQQVQQQQVKQQQVQRQQVQRQPVQQQQVKQQQVKQQQVQQQQVQRQPVQQQQVKQQQVKQQQVQRQHEKQPPPQQQQSGVHPQQGGEKVPAGEAHGEGEAHGKGKDKKD